MAVFSSFLDWYILPLNKKQLELNKIAPKLGDAQFLDALTPWEHGLWTRSGMPEVIWSGS